MEKCQLIVARSLIARGEANINRRVQIHRAVKNASLQFRGKNASKGGGKKREGGGERKRGEIKTVYLYRGPTRAGERDYHAYITWRYRSRRTHARCYSRVHNETEPEKGDALT